MRQAAAGYRPSDAWLLLAVLKASQAGPARLDQVVAAGDYINHAVFTADELEGGLRRLSAGGLIGERRGRFAVTRKVLSYREGSLTPRRSVHSQLKDMERLPAVA